MTAKAPTSLPPRQLLVPEVIQSSTMDCGPACLKALLSGFGIPVNYSRLREACQTDVDGTSIDVLQDVAQQLGLAANQFIVPTDHLLLAEADSLPAVVATRLPNGLAHFVVVWRTHGRLVQVMDPASGRLFYTKQRFLRDVWIHHFPTTPRFARRWLSTPAFLSALRRRLADLGCSEDEREAVLTEMLDQGSGGNGWLPLAALDAATRLTAQLVGTGAVKRGNIAARFASRLAAEATRQGPAAALTLLPAQYWSVGTLPSGELYLRGAVLVRAARRSTEKAMPAPGLAHSPELIAAVAGESTKPLRSILAAAYAAHRAELLALPPALLLAGASTTLEALLLSGFVGLGQKSSHTVSARAVLLVAAFLPIALLLNVSIAAGLMRLQRWLELHLRIRLLDKLPRLGNYYFHSRLKSDLAMRAYGLRSLRGLPQIFAGGLRIVSELLLTVTGLIWLWPASAFPVLVTMVVIVGLPLLLMPLLNAQDLRLQTHSGVLSGFYLDSLQGLMPLRAHRAELPVRAAHETLLAKWAAALRQFYWTQLGGLGLGLLAGVGFAIWMVSTSVAGRGGSENRILAIYWALKLPLLSQELAGVLRGAPGLYNNLLRLFDVLNSREETELHGGRPENSADSQADSLPPAADSREKAEEGRGAGARIAMHKVAVQAGGHRILTDIDLEIAPGEHVSIVGPSGSGKTSLVGLLLGWHRAADGAVLIDGEPADAERIRRLRRETAWVDPAVQLWNRSLEQNLRYGNGDLSAEALKAAVHSADLDEVVERLPTGMASSLGEGGGLLSGGEGQRVRLARAMLRTGVRLAILDEPFRGLDHDKRLLLLGVARRRFADATLIYVSHDIDTALDFARILVVENGRIVEDGSPAELLQRQGSRLAAIRQAHESLKQELWRNPVWHRWQMDHGMLRESDPEKGEAGDR